MRSKGESVGEDSEKPFSFPIKSNRQIWWVYPFLFFSLWKWLVCLEQQQSSCDNEVPKMRKRTKALRTAEKENRKEPTSCQISQGILPTESPILKPLLVGFSVTCPWTYSHLIPQVLMNAQKWALRYHYLRGNTCSELQLSDLSLWVTI